MKKQIITMVITLFVLSIFSTPTLAQQFEYTANKEKSFANENDFYQQLKKGEYKEFKDAKYSVRKKSLIKTLLMPL